MIRGGRCKAREDGDRATEGGATPGQGRDGWVKAPHGNDVKWHRLHHIVMVTPMVFAFVVLGVIIVWKTTSNPSAVAPHLDLILVAFAVFSNPVSAALGAIMQRYADQKGNGGKGKDA